MDLCKGLKKTKNALGQSVLWLHYSADPLKDPDNPVGKKWFETESSNTVGGPGGLKWRAEYEMDFSAGSGELVFPEFSDKRDKIVVKPFEIDETYLVYAGMDWGTVNPVSFHVYAESPEKQFFSVWEFYETKVTIRRMAEILRTQCPYYDRLQWIAMDPRAFNSHQQGREGLTTLGEMFTDPDYVGEYTIDKLMPGHGCEDKSMINRVRNLWAYEDPKLKFFNICTHQINEIQNLLHPPSDGRTNFRETIVDKNNHSWDDLKYFLESHPYATKAEEKPKFGTVGYMDEITDLANSISQRNGTSLQDEFNHLWGMNL
jgi:hypothetical protein